MNEVNRQVFVDDVRAFGYDTSEIHTDTRSVMEHYDREGTLFAMAEYIKVPGDSCKVIYRTQAMP